jgi:hypothetical protein
MLAPLPRRAHILAAATLLALAACDEPVAPEPGVTPLFASTTDAIFNVQLRTLPGFATLQWGYLQIRMMPVDPCVPPNPVVPQGETLIGVCGRIFNEGGAAYSGGGLYTVPTSFDELPILLAPFNSTAPVDPCRRYDLGGYITVPDEVAGNLLAEPSRYQVIFDAATPDGTETQIGGRLDGLAWGPTGVKSEQDAFFGSNVCAIDIAP